jgi:hypothetical protein
MSDLLHPFSNEARSLVSTALDKLCVDGNRITFSELLSELGFKPDSSDVDDRSKFRLASSIVAVMLKTNFDNYDLLDAKIGKIGSPRASDSLVYPKNFCDKLQVLLDNIAHKSNPTSVHSIVLALARDGVQFESLKIGQELVLESLQKQKVTGFVTQKNGICKL